MGAALKTKEEQVYRSSMYIITKNTDLCSFKGKNVNDTLHFRDERVCKWHVSEFLPNLQDDGAVPLLLRCPSVVFL